jgi:hypothetical protein
MAYKALNTGEFFTVGGSLVTDKDGVTLMEKPTDQPDLEPQAVV